MSAEPLHTLRWDVLPPPGSDGAAVAEVVRFRARVLFADGLRPSFRGADGRYRDPDPADADAHHVAVSDPTGILASFRALPLGQSHAGLCERLLGADGLDRLLWTVGASRADTWEGGGWAVDSAARSEGLGMRVLAAGVAVAERLGLRTMVGAAGTRHGQYERLASVGYRPVPGLGLLPVRRLADELRMVYAVTAATRPSFRAMVRESAAVLV